MFGLLFLAVCAIDGMVIGGLINAFLFNLSGNTASYRLMQIIVAIPCGIAYTIFALNAGCMSQINSGLATVIIVAPVTIIFLLYIIMYIKNGNNN